VLILGGYGNFGKRMPCIGMIALQEYLDALKPFKIKTHKFDDHIG
jgi:hypothetical protein